MNVTELPISIPQIGALIVAGIASYTDIRTDKIPNLLTLPGALVGCITLGVWKAMTTPDSAVQAGIAGFIQGILGWILGVVIMEVHHAFLRKLGHGDSKLLGALGAFVGPAMIVVTFIYYGIAFGLYSFTIMGSALPWRQLPVAYSTKTLKGLDLERFHEVRKRPLPMAPIIFIGLIVAVVFQHQTMHFLGLE